MDINRLKTIIQEFLKGRQEDEEFDAKTAWWNLKNKDSQEELAKDIAGFANSHNEKDSVIICGLGKHGLQEAPLPRDEAQIQELIKNKILPQPRIRIQEHKIEGFRISTIEILGEFDRPYVAKRNNRNMVWIRQGSRTGTATRYDLDQMYKSTAIKPLLHWVIKHLPRELPGIDFPKEPPLNILTLANRPLRSIEEIKTKISIEFDEVKAHEKARLDPNYKEKCSTYQSNIAKFLRQVEEVDGYRKWYASEHSDIAQWASLKLTNPNKGALRDVEIKVRLPDHIGVFEDTPTYRPGTPLWPKKPEFKWLQVKPIWQTSFLGPLLKHSALDPSTEAMIKNLAIQRAPKISPPKEPLRARIDGHELVFHAEKIRQNDSVEFPQGFCFLAYPDAPAGRIDLAVEIRADELLGKKDTKLRVEIKVET